VGTGGATLRAGRLRAEVQCRDEASRQGIVVPHSAKARIEGSYWSTTVEGQLRGTCRYYQAQNRADLKL